MTGPDRPIPDPISAHGTSGAKPAVVPEGLAVRIGLVRGLALAAIAIERILAAALPFFGVVALFAILSWFGLFRLMPDWLRYGTGLAVLGASVVTFARILGIAMPTRREADARVERESGLEHQAISVLSDQPATDGPMARELFALHQARMASTIGRLFAGLPAPDIAARDPHGLRGAIVPVLVIGWFFSATPHGGSLGDVLRPPQPGAATAIGRLDAWLTPPAYTGRAPVYLRPGLATVSVPEGSVLAVRQSQAGEPPLVKRLSDGAQLALAAEATTARPDAARTAPQAFTLMLDQSVAVAFADGTVEITIEPDTPPVISFAKEPTATVRGALEISFEARDDYGVAEAHAEIVPLEGDPSAFGLYGPPDYRLDIPANGRKSVKATSSRDLTEHPLSGRRVRLTLVARDAAGREGRSDSRDIVLPERPFTQPLAASVVEQRQVFALDPRNIDRALELGEAALLRADETVPKIAHFLAARTAMERLMLARSEADLKAAADYYWEVARGIEDGDLASAEDRLKAAQQALSDALKRNASDEEIKQLMAELRKAMQDYLNELAKRQTPGNQQMAQGDMKMLRSQDLEKMLDQLENLARQGAKDQAQQLLNDMQRLMNNLQTARPNQQNDQRDNPMRREIDKLGRIIEEQQKLMEQTHRLDQALKDRQQFGDPPEDGGSPDQLGEQEGEDGAAPEDGQQGQQGEQGEQGEDQAGPNGKPLDKMTAEELKEALRELKKRQQGLSKQLGELDEALKGLGLKPVPGFKDGQKRMGDAAGDLGRPDSESAIGNQGKALEALRQGASDLMQQMMQAGRNPGQGMPGGQNQTGRDPLGRNPGNQDGNGDQIDGSVKVPEEADIQRAREILEEIRRKLSEGGSGTIERDYLERLLDLK